MRYDSTAHTDEVLAQWAFRNPDSARDLLTNPRANDQHQILRGVLNRTERAMRSEGVEPAVRLRVINTVVFGGPDPDEVKSTDEIRRIQRNLLTMLVDQPIHDAVIRLCDADGNPTGDPIPVKDVRITMQPPGDLP